MLHQRDADDRMRTTTLLQQRQTLHQLALPPPKGLVMKCFPQERGVAALEPSPRSRQTIYSWSPRGSRSTVKSLSKGCIFTPEVASKAVIDATSKGNISRFINHSCDPRELRIGFLGLFVPTRLLIGIPSLLFFCAGKSHVLIGSETIKMIVLNS